MNTSLRILIDVSITIHIFYQYVLMSHSILIWKCLHILIMQLNIHSSLLISYMLHLITLLLHNHSSINYYLMQMYSILLLINHPSVLIIITSLILLYNYLFLWSTPLSHISWNNLIILIMLVITIWLIYNSYSLHVHSTYVLLWSS